MSYSESYWTSYIDTTIVTITSTIPCETYISYTTTYVCARCSCPNCPPSNPQTTCLSKSCSAGPDTVGTATYDPDESAPALITTPGGSSSYGYVPATLCPAFYPFNSDATPTAGMTACASVPVPPPTETCLASPCIESVATTVTCVPPNPSTYKARCSESTMISTITGFGPYPPGAADVPLATDLELLVSSASCLTFTSLDINGNTPMIPATASCAVSSVGYAGGEDGTCAASVVTYTYTTDGAQIVVATTMPQRCGPFSLSGGADRLGTYTQNLLVRLWGGLAIISGIGMIVL